MTPMSRGLQFIVLQGSLARSEASEAAAKPDLGSQPSGPITHMLTVLLIL